MLSLWRPMGDEPLLSARLTTTTSYISIPTLFLHLFLYLYRLQKPQMYSLVSLVLFAVAAELLRRCCMILITAFTGPLAKIPGPLIYKLTAYPWIFQNITGNMMNVAPDLFKRYGDIIRVSRCNVSQNHIESN